MKFVAVIMEGHAVLCVVKEARFHTAPESA